MILVDEQEMLKLANPIKKAKTFPVFVYLAAIEFKVEFYRFCFDRAISRL